MLVAGQAKLVEASVNGRTPEQVRTETGRTFRIKGVERATLPANPPSRLRFLVDVPKGGRLTVAAGIPRRHQHDPAVEFVVRARRGGTETTLLSRLVDPANRPADRDWVPLQADLSGVAGRGVELVLETRGFEPAPDGDRALWANPAITADAREAPLVVVYLVDTLRADHLHLYGYPRETSPELDRLARDSVVFEQAIAASAWTKPSVASLLTSLPPSTHGCVQLFIPLDPSLVTLAERMQAAGYGTGAVVANVLVLASDAHFDQGFSYFAAPREPQRAEQVVDAALDFLDSRRGLPTFLYVHAMDPHSPYDPPPPFDRRFGPPPLAGRRAAEPSEDYREPADRERIVGQYDGEVAYGDQQLGRFLRGLQDRDLYQRALVVFLADHGEELLDHGDWGHGQSVFDELVRVPLVVKFPGNREAGRRLKRQVQLVDVLPTVLAAEQLPVPGAPEIAGRPLQASLGADAAERPATFETKAREFVVFGVRTSTDKYVHQLSPEDRELYFDLARDPGERASRFADAGPRGQELKRLAELALGKGVYQYRLRVSGDAAYELRIRTAGWIDSLDASGLGSSERVSLDGDRRGAALRLRPRAASPREVVVLTRPHGVLMWISGTRDGRPLAASDVRFGADAVPASSDPFKLPEVEAVPGLLSPPRTPRPGVAVWIEPAAGRQAAEPDAATRETLKALGYIK